MIIYYFFNCAIYAGSYWCKECYTTETNTMGKRNDRDDLEATLDPSDGPANCKKLKVNAAKPAPSPKKPNSTSTDSKKAKKPPRK